MIWQILWVVILTASCVLLHGGCTFGLIRHAHAKTDHRRISLFKRWILFTEIIIALLLLHGGEASIWALFYIWKGGMADAATALYFSIVSYATIGYGDVLLPKDLRLVGAFEGLVGTLLSGWSVAIIVALLQVIIIPKKNAQVADALPGKGNE